MRKPISRPPVDAEARGDRAERRDDVLADAILVGGGVCVVGADLAIADADLDVVGKPVAHDPAELGLVEPVELVAEPPDLLERQLELVA